jgi:hypothetical protein
MKACSQPTGYVADKTDCCDKDGNTHPGSNTCSINPNGCSGYDYDCDGMERECNAPISTCPENGICSDLGVCTASTCKNYGYNFQGEGCGLSYTYLVTTQGCANDPSGCMTTIEQNTGSNIACN